MCAVEIESIVLQRCCSSARLTGITGVSFIFIRANVTKKRSVNKKTTTLLIQIQLAAYTQTTDKNTNVWLCAENRITAVKMHDSIHIL